MNCPACKSNKFKALDPFRVLQEGTQNILPVDYQILMCDVCGLYYKDNIPDISTLERYYNSLGDGVWEYSVVHPHEVFLDKFISKLPDNSNVLDVGCNTGRLLASHSKRLNCFGVEINTEAAKIAAERGLKVIAAKIKPGFNGEVLFNMITLIDVFEHLNDPIPFVQTLVHSLAPNGKIYIFTGRTESLPAIITRSYFWYYRLAQHLIFLNQKFVKWLSKSEPQLSIRYLPYTHFHFGFKQKIYHISWYIAWRLFSPNSPYRLFSINSLSRMTSPFMITSWKDHAFVIIEKKT